MSKKCQHDWEYHITEYRCGVSEHFRKCKKCGKYEDLGTYNEKEEKICR